MCNCSQEIVAQEPDPMTHMRATIGVELPGTDQVQQTLPTITGAIEYNESLLTDLANSIEALETTLSPVSYPKPEAHAGENTANKPVLSPHMDRIINQGDALVMLIRKIGDIQERLQV